MMEMLLLWFVLRVLSYLTRQGILRRLQVAHFSLILLLIIQQIPQKGNPRHDILPLYLYSCNSSIVLHRKDCGNTAHGDAIIIINYNRQHSRNNNCHDTHYWSSLCVSWCTTTPFRNILHLLANFLLNACFFLTVSRARCSVSLREEIIMSNVSPTEKVIINCSLVPYISQCEQLTWFTGILAFGCRVFRNE